MFMALAAHCWQPGMNRLSPGRICEDAIRQDDLLLSSPCNRCDHVNQVQMRIDGSPIADQQSTC